MDTQETSHAQAQPNTGKSLIDDQPVTEIAPPNIQPHNPLGTSIIAQMPTLEGLRAAINPKAEAVEEAQAPKKTTRRDRDDAVMSLVEALALDRLPTANVFLAEKLKASLSTVSAYREAEDESAPQTAEQVAMVGNTGVTDADGSAPHPVPVGLGTVSE